LLDRLRPLLDLALDNGQLAGRVERTTMLDFGVLQLG
jgi:hypothetical protein